MLFEKKRYGMYVGLIALVVIVLFLLGIGF